MHARTGDISVDMPTFSPYSPGVIVIDGGLSTQLASVTGEAVDGHPLWTARYLSRNPEAVFQAHLEFLNGKSSSLKQYAKPIAVVCMITAWYGRIVSVTASADPILKSNVQFQFRGILMSITDNRETKLTLCVANYPNMTN